jgi:ribosomal protein S18 acetylase RimI-like enzyme
MNIVPLTAAHYPDIERIQHLAYTPDLVEPIEVLGRKAELAPDCCFAAEVDGLTVAYVLAHPWDRDSAPGLSAALPTLPETAPVVHIHDLAIDPAFGGRGIARALVDAVTNAAQGQGREALTLVAVQGADSFWKRMGFVVEKVASGYDEAAVFMRKSLASL